MVEEKGWYLIDEISLWKLATNDEKEYYEKTYCPTHPVIWMQYIINALWDWVHTLSDRLFDNVRQTYYLGYMDARLITKEE